MAGDDLPLAVFAGPLVGAVDARGRCWCAPRVELRAAVFRSRRSARRREDGESGPTRESTSRGTHGALRREHNGRWRQSAPALEGAEMSLLKALTLHDCSAFSIHNHIIIQS